jgi:hypothetical protein
VDNAGEVSHTEAHTAENLLSAETAISMLKNNYCSPCKF